jgi:hypothetical protein
MGSQNHEKMATATNTKIINFPPKEIKRAINADPVKAIIAVKNQPPITAINTEIRKTALSRYHAVSERELPMATIKVM